MTGSARSKDASPFHDGEQAIQTRLGVRDRLETFGRMVIRDHLPDQHRAFYAKLPFLLVGSVDAAGRPWASVLVGEPGFLRSPDPRLLVVETRPLAGDPLAGNLRAGAPLGVLGLQSETRRRNRMSGRVTKIGPDAFTIGVVQTFGNCPQYIQTRRLAFARPPSAVADQVEPARLVRLDGRARDLIAKLDAFFVATHNPSAGGAAARGVDVSHRGGRPGFVRVEADGRTLTIPDFPGNLHFNTLGNLLVDPRAGLLFPDFESGDLLTLTGRAEIVWDGEEVEAFQGAERLWRFTLDEGFHLTDALPLRGRLGEWSPNTLLTGTWDEAERTKRARALRDRWRPFRIVRTVRESAAIRSLHLAPADDAALPSFQAGQYMPVRIRSSGAAPPTVRTYTVSNAPGEPTLRLSVKREGRGGASDTVHNELREGDLMEAMAPRGGFTFDPAAALPVALVSAGVGITPMIAMLRHAYREAVRTRHARQLWFVHAARTSSERAFFDEVRSIGTAMGGAVQMHFVLSEPSAADAPGVDFHSQGRIDADLLWRLLPLPDCDVYLCGPTAMTQSLYDCLRGFDVADDRIHAEAFGPTSLKRRSSAQDDGSPPLSPAEDPVAVSFVASGRTLVWRPGAGSLLDLAEADGLAPAFGCRVGACGTCAVRIAKGQVAYTTRPAASVAVDTALLCSAMPAATTGSLEIDA